MDERVGVVVTAVCAVGVGVCARKSFIIIVYSHFVFKNMTQVEKGVHKPQSLNSKNVCNKCCSLEPLFQSHITSLI